MDKKYKAGELEFNRVRYFYPYTKFFIMNNKCRGYILPIYNNIFKLDLQYKSITNII